MPNGARCSAVDSDPRALVGRWDLDRRVTDRLERRTGRMWGTLTVSELPRPFAATGPTNPVGGLRHEPIAGQRGEVGLRWEEEGTLHLAGKCLHAYRNLALAVVGGEWWMTFENGALFHRWQPGELLEHPCGEDSYTGWLDLDPDGELRTLWDVTGPTKRQRIFTRYRHRNH